jgi:bifunctional aspartokinase / homoserine dehydrogenase 1
MDTRDVLIVNPTGSDQVDPDYPKSEKKLKEWFSSHNPACTIIATGFIASTADDVPTTLKRDGSDFSAAILGALVRARQVTIWTDVDGVYSADPRKGPPPPPLMLCIYFTWCAGQCLHEQMQEFF